MGERITAVRVAILFGVVALGTEIARPVINSRSRTGATISLMVATWRIGHS